MRKKGVNEDPTLPHRVRIFLSPIGFLERSKNEKIRKCTDKQAKTL